MEAKKLDSLNQDSDIESIFMAVKEARTGLREVTGNTDFSENSKVKSLLDKLVAPEVNTAPKLSETMYVNEEKLKEQYEPSTSVFPSMKALLFSVAATALLGFLVGAKIGLSIYYANTPADTKITLIDMMKILF